MSGNWELEVATEVMDMSAEDLQNIGTVIQESSKAVDALIGELYEESEGTFSDHLKEVGNEFVDLVDACVQVIWDLAKGFIRAGESLVGAEKNAPDSLRSAGIGQGK